MSKVQICNRGASQYLGVGRINSFSEASPQAEQYELHYDDLRKSLLEKHWWVFATGIQRLAQVENDRPNEWAFKYVQPGNIIKVRWVNELSAATQLAAAGKNPDTPRKMVEGYIYSNVADASVEFTKNEENTDLMPQYFKEALSGMVAAAVAMPITQSVSRAKFASDQAGLRIDEAIAHDEDETPLILLPYAEYHEARGAQGTIDHWGR